MRAKRSTFNQCADMTDDSFFETLLRTIERRVRQRYNTRLAAFDERRLLPMKRVRA